MKKKVVSLLEHAKSKPWKQYNDWLWETLFESKGATTYTSAVPATNFVVKLRTLLKGISEDRKKWQQKMAPLGSEKSILEVLVKVSQVQGRCSVRGSTACQPLLNGASEVRYFVQGAEVFVGIAIPNDIAMMSLKSLIQTVEAMDGSDLQSMLCQVPNFVARMQAGDILVVPAGFLLLQLIEEDSVVYRMTISPNLTNEDNTVLGIVGKVLELYPHLQKSPWKH